MITISIAGLSVGLQTRNRSILRRCSRFLTGSAPDWTVSVTDRQIAQEQKSGQCNADNAAFVCFHREIADILPGYNRFVFHGAAIEYNGRCYLFAAKSGTGKTTHILLWRDRYADKVSIVNGDKPILWKKDDRWYACPTPWCGKEGLAGADCVPVAGLCFLERAEHNTIRRAAANEITDRVFHQLYLPKEADALRQTLVLAVDFLKSTPSWVMGCNMNIEAAEIAHDAMISESAQNTEAAGTQGTERSF